MEDLFRFGENTALNPDFAFAVQIVPQSEMVRRICTESGAVARYPSGAFDLVLAGGACFPDVIGVAGQPFLVVSEAVVASWQTAGLSSFHVYPVGVAEIQSSTLSARAAPRYSRVEIDGRCSVDLEASGLAVVEAAPECHYLLTRPAVASGFRLLAGSWDGSALFRDTVLYPRVNFCTPVVLEIARRERFTNFRFEPMAGPFDFAGPGMEYL